MTNHHIPVLEVVTLINFSIQMENTKKVSPVQEDSQGEEKRVRLQRNGGSGPRTAPWPLPQPALARRHTP